MAKNTAKREELFAYLTKPTSEIIHYEKRKATGKKIGSGRVEKANDVLVAHRQKKKGMAWSRTGSESLAILKALEINHRLPITPTPVVSREAISRFRLIKSFQK